MKLPDTVVACKIIKYKRAYNRRAHLKKNISVPIKEFDVFARLCITFNKYTGIIYFSHCLRYQTADFCPTTNQRLRCTNQHALDMLKQHRTWRDRRKKVIGGFKR